jgi:hypothetical protein
VFFFLANIHCQHAILEFGPYLPAIRSDGKRYGSPEGYGPCLAPVEAILVMIDVCFFLSFKRQNIILDSKADILAIHTWQINSERTPELN